jgi:hypothetical protein
MSVENQRSDIAYNPKLFRSYLSISLVITVAEKRQIIGLFNDAFQLPILFNSNYMIIYECESEKTCQNAVTLYFMVYCFNTGIEGLRKITLH